LTGAGATVGTVNYISPEQAANSSEVDHRADIYSLGCTFYTLLTGKPPFHGSSAHEVLAKHKSQAVTRPETISPRVDRRLSDIMMKMVEKRPENRYSNLGGLISDLESYLRNRLRQRLQRHQSRVELDASLKSYYSQPLAQARTYLPIAFVLLGLIIAGIVSQMSFRWAFACLCG
jgi:serine/threonine protein kinase